MASLRASAPAVQSSSYPPWSVGSFESGGSSGSRSGTPRQSLSPAKAALPTLAAVTVLEPSFPEETHSRPLFGMLTDHLDQMVRITTWPALRLPFNIQHGTVLTLRLFRTPPSSTEGFSEFDFVAGLQVPVGKLLAMGNPLQCWCALSADIGTLVADCGDRAGAAMEAFKAGRQKATYEICPKVFIALRPLRQEHAPRSTPVGESTATPLSVSGSSAVLRSNMPLSPLSSVSAWDQSPSQTDALLMARVTPQRTRSNSPSASIQMVQAELSAERQQLLKDISALTAEAQRQSATTRALGAHEASAFKEEQRVQNYLELRDRLAELQQETQLQKLALSSASSRAAGSNSALVAETSGPDLREVARQAQDERQQIKTLRFELRAERDRFKALQQSTDVEKYGTNRHMSELYAMLEAERRAVSLWQEDSLEGQLSWCSDRARWHAKVESLQSELAHLENGETEPAVSNTTGCMRLDFHFDKLRFEEVDREVFRNEFVLGLGMLGVTPALLGRLKIAFREGSVIAGAEGSAAAINDLKKLLLTGQLSVMGSEARVEEAVVHRQAEREDLKQRAVALSQECEVLKSRRLYEDLYTRYEALELEHEVLENRSAQAVEMADHEALKLAQWQLEQEQEARTLESCAISSSDYFALQERLKSLSAELEALEQECARRVDSKDHEALQRQYEALQSEHESLRNAADALKKQTGALESCVPRSLPAPSVGLTEFEGLQGKHELLEGKHELLQCKHKGLEGKHELLERECEDLRKASSILDALSSENKELKACRQECEDLRRAASQLDAVSSENKELKAVWQECVELRRTVSQSGALSSENKELKDRCDRLQHEIGELRVKATLTVDAERHVESERERHVELERRFASLSQEHKAHAEKHMDLKRRFASLSQEHETDAEKHGDLKRRFASLSQEHKADAEKRVEMERRFSSLSQEHKAQETKHVRELEATQARVMTAQQELTAKDSERSRREKELSEENRQLDEMKDQLMRSSKAAELSAQKDVEELQKACRALQTELQTMQRSHEVEMQSMQAKHDDLSFRLEHDNESWRTLKENEREALQVHNRALERGHQQLSKEVEREHQNFSDCRQLLQERFHSSHVEMHETFSEEMQAADRMHALKLVQEMEAAQKKHDRAMESAQRAHSQAFSECERNLEQAERALERRWEAELREECSRAASAVVAADAAGSARATSALQGRAEMLKGELRDFQVALQQEKERSASEAKAAESGTLEAADKIALLREAMANMEEQLLAAQNPASNNLLLLEQQEQSHAATRLELRELQEAEAQDNKKREEIDSVRAQILGTIEARVSMLQDEVVRERDLYGYHAGHGAKLETQFEELRAYTEERDEQLQELQALCEDPELWREPDDAAAAMISSLRSECAQAYRVEKQMQDANTQLLTEYRVAEGMLAAQDPMLCDVRHELAASEAECRVLRQELLDHRRSRPSSPSRQRAGAGVNASPVAVDTAKGAHIQRTPSFEVIHVHEFDNAALHDQEGSTAALSAASSRPSTPHTADSHGRSHFRRMNSAASSISAASAAEGDQVSNGELLALPPSPSREEVQWVVDIDRSSGDALGIDLHGTTLLIDSVMDGGLFSKWNRANPFQAILAGDRIRAVNGRLRPEDIIAEMQDYKPLSITMVREASADDEANVANGQMTEDALMLMDVEVQPQGSPTARSAQRTSTVAPDRAAGRNSLRSSKGGSGASTRKVELKSRSRIEQAEDAHIRRREGAGGAQIQRLNSSQSSPSTPKSSTGYWKSAGAATVPPAVGSRQVERRQRTDSLSRSGSERTVGSNSASDQRPNTNRNPVKAKASSKATAERKGLDVFMASLRG